MFGKKKCEHGKLQSHIDTGEFICDDCGMVLVNGEWYERIGAEVIEMNGKKKEGVTHGQYLVGVSFNPGGHPEVDAIKNETAVLIDRMDDVFQNGHDEQARCAVMAMQAYELAAMWAVKAVTKPERE